MKIYWVWMLQDGRRVLRLARFTAEADAVAWMKSQTPPAGMALGVHYEKESE